ncbi:MAG: hypothetical protein ACMUHY_00680 [Thermoplasmatota archaeon]
MRCSKCHRRMEEEVKESVFRGTTVVHTCPRCDNEVVEHKGGSIFSNLFGLKHDAIEVDHRTARSIELH